MHGGLARGICSADDVNGFAATRDGFGGATSVIDTGALEAFDAGDVQAAPLNAHGEEQGVAGDFGAIGELDETVRSVDAQAHDVLRRKDFDTETAGLCDSAEGQVSARQSGW